MCMKNKDALLVRKITHEYLDFMKKIKVNTEEVKRATVIALKKVLKLENGDQVLINEDGSLEVEGCSDGGKSNV